jgi:hypothetical protein
MDFQSSQMYGNAFVPSMSIGTTANTPPLRSQTQWSLQPELQPQPQLQPQQELYLVVPLGGEQNETRKYTAKDWEEQRVEITRLYEKNTLAKVIELMREQHGLYAT